MFPTPVIRLPLLVASLAALIPALRGEDQPTTTPPAESLQVEAPRDPALTSPDTTTAMRERLTIPGGATVIDAESYKSGRASTLRDALGWAPGVIVQPRFGSEESRLSIRGSGIQRTFHLRGITLLQDGFALNQADGGGDFQTVEVAALDHIEVYRGANALRYGAASLGGAINFVTPTGRTAPLADLRLEGGSFGYLRALAASGGQRGDLDWYVAASASRQDGYRDHSQQRNLRGTANVGYRLTDHVENRVYLAASDTDSELPGALTRSQFASDPQQARPGNVTADQKRDYQLYRVADVIAVNAGSERLEAGLSWTTKDLFHPIFQVLDNYSNDYAGMVRFITAAPIAGFNNRFTLGLNGVHGETNDDRFVNVGGQKGAPVSSADLTAQGVELYGEDQFHLTEEFTLIAGVQLAWCEREVDYQLVTAIPDPANYPSGSSTYHAVNPKVGALWQVTPHAQMFGNVSRSFEPPSFAELGTNAGAFPQDIAAQSAWTAELGTRGASERITWDLTLYHAWVSDELLSYSLGNGAQRTVNADRTIHLGCEAGLDVTLLRSVIASGDALLLRQAYTYGRFTFDGDPLYGDHQIPGLPEHVYRVELLWSWDGWFAGTGVEVQSAYALDYANTTDNDAFVLLGARAGYRAARGWAVFVEGRNLADVSHVPTTNVANPASATPVDNQELLLPGDGLGVVGGVEWRY